MITYENINPLQAEIKYKGKTVGYLEKLIDCYVLELDYFRQVVDKHEAKYIKDYITNQMLLNERMIESELIHKRNGFKVKS